MLPDLLLIVASGAAAFLGAACGRRVRWYVPLVPPVEREQEIGHEHAWGIAGKEGGVVMLECHGCPARKPRDG